MNPALIVAVVGIGMTFSGGVLSFMLLMWRIGRWQAGAEGRTNLLVQRFDAVDARLDRINGSVGEAHRRIDAYLAP